MADETTVMVLVWAGVGLVLVARLGSSPSDALRQPGQVLRIVLAGSIVGVVLLVVARFEAPLAVALSALFLAGAFATFGERASATVVRAVNRAAPPGKALAVTAGAYGDPGGTSAAPGDWTGQRSAYWGSARLPTVNLN